MRMSDTTHYPAVSLAKEITLLFYTGRERANRSFVASIINSQCKILKKIHGAGIRPKIVSLCRGQLHVDAKEAFTSKLVKLFEILICKCEMMFLLLFDLASLQMLFAVMELT